jgi:hypothetical protein
MNDTNSTIADDSTSSTQFAAMDPEAQTDTVHSILFGKGAMLRDAAITFIAEALRDRGLAEFSRLRKDGPIRFAIDDAVTRCIKQHRIDKPKRGHVRAVIIDPKDYTEVHWRMIHKSALADCTGDSEEETIRIAAEWARENCGLEFERFSMDGALWKGLNDALYK